jgi:chemotaxis protein MotD
VAQLNFPETKIDAPLLALKQARRESELPKQDGGEDFDRLVAKAAEKGKMRNDPAKAGHRAEASEESAAADSRAAGDASSLSDAANPDEPATDVSIPMPDANQDPALPAAVVTILLPVADAPIKLPAMDSASSNAASTAPTAVAANGNIKLPQLAAATGADDSAVPIPSADIEALIAALPQASQPQSNKRTASDLGALPQTSSGSAEAAPQLRLVPAAAPVVGTPPAAAPEANAAEASMRPDIAVKGASAGQALDSAVKQANDDQTTAETVLAPAELETQPTGLSLARHFVRDVATQYQATADAGNATRSASDASAADQVSIRLIHSLHEGRKAVQIHLTPSELGSIDVSMQWQGDRLTAHFVVDRPETLDLLQRDIKILEQSLGDSGFSSDNGGLSFSLRQQMENQGERRSGNGPSDPELPQNADPEPLIDESSAVRDGVLVLRV